MLKFSQRSSPEEFQTVYRRLNDTIHRLRIESDQEMQKPVTTPEQSRLQLTHIIQIIDSTLQALNEWYDTLTQEKNLLHPARKRLSEIDTDLQQIHEKILLLQGTKIQDENALSAILNHLAPTHHQNEPDADENAHPAFGFGR